MNEIAIWFNIIIRGNLFNLPKKHFYWYLYTQILRFSTVTVNISWMKTEYVIFFSHVAQNEIEGQTVWVLMAQFQENTKFKTKLLMLNYF